MPARDEVIAAIQYYLQVVSEALVRVQSLPFASSERLKRIREFRAHRDLHIVHLERLRGVPAEAAILELEEARRRLTSLKNEYSQLSAEFHALVRGPDIPDEQDVQFLQGRIAEHQQIIFDTETQCSVLENDRIPQLIAKAKNSPADKDLLDLEGAVKTLVDDVSKFEEAETKGTNLDAGLFIDFNAKLDYFTESSDFHRKQAFSLIIVMAAIVALSGGVIYWLFVNVPVLFEGSVGELEKFKAYESVVLTGVGRVSVLALVAWALTFVGGLYRVHSEQAVLYRDKRAALGVITNVLRAANDPAKKHHLLQRVLRGYLGFEHNAFRIDMDSRRRKGAKALSSEIRYIKDAVDLVSPLLGHDSKTKSQPKISGKPTSKKV